MSSLLANLARFVKTIIPHHFILDKMQNSSSQFFGAREFCHFIRNLDNGKRCLYVPCEAAARRNRDVRRTSNVSSNTE